MKFLFDFFYKPISEEYIGKLGKRGGRKIRMFKEIAFQKETIAVKFPRCWK